MEVAPIYHLIDACVFVHKVLYLIGEETNCFLALVVQPCSFAVKNICDACGGKGYLVLCVQHIVVPPILSSLAALLLTHPEQPGIGCGSLPKNHKRGIKVCYISFET